MRIKNTEHKIELYISKRDMHQFAIRVCGRIENDDKSPSTMSKYQNFNETKRCFDHKKDIVLDLSCQHKIFCFCK